MEIYTKANEVFEQIHNFENFDLQWKKLMHFWKKNYDTISKTIEI